MKVQEIVEQAKIKRAKQFYMAGLLSYQEYLTWRGETVVTDDAHEVNKWEQSKTR